MEISKKKKEKQSMINGVQGGYGMSEVSMSEFNNNNI